MGVRALICSPGSPQQHRQGCGPEESSARSVSPHLSAPAPALRWLRLTAHASSVAAPDACLQQSAVETWRMAVFFPCHSVDPLLVLLDVGNCQVLLRK